MNYSPDLKKRIRARHHTGMSVRRISEIYGGTPYDIAAVINETRMARSPDIAQLSHASGGATSKPLRLYDSLPPVIQTYAFMVAKNRGVPVLNLFSAGIQHGQKNVIARGCLFYGLKRQFGWPYSRISTACGLSVTSICHSVKRYCQSSGMQRPNTGRPSKAEEYVLENRSQ